MNIPRFTTWPTTQTKDRFGEFQVGLREIFQAYHPSDFKLFQAATSSLDILQCNIFSAAGIPNLGMF